MGISSRNLVLGLATVGLILGALATVRLGAVVSATPASLWLDPYPRLVDPNASIDEGTRDRAVVLARVLGDPGLLRGAIDNCIRGGGSTGADGTSEECLATIDSALRTVPSSGELWLQKARLLLVSEGLGEPVYDSLRNSYRVAPKEAWIAASRVVVGLRIYAALPDDLKEHVRNDMALVMQRRNLSAAVVAVYANDPSFREAARPALEVLSPELVSAFAELVGDRFEAPPSG